MMSRTLGAPLGGTTLAGQKGFDPRVVRSIVPPNFWSGAGSCLPEILLLAAGEPGGDPFPFPFSLAALTSSSALASAIARSRPLVAPSEQQESAAAFSFPSSVLGTREGMDRCRSVDSEL